MKRLLSLTIALVLVFSMCICFTACTEKNINDANNTSAPTATTSDTVNKTTSSRYYQGTDIPDYTHVTGISQKRSPHYADDCVIYSYRYTEYGEYSEMVDYIGYLLKNGWNSFKEEKDDTSLTYSYFKNDSLVMINYDAKLDEVAVVVGED